MAHPVMWFEVLGKDGSRLQQFYGGLFGWTFEQSTAPRGQRVIVGRNARKNSEITSPIEVRTQANRIHRL